MKWKSSSVLFLFLALSIFLVGCGEPDRMSIEEYNVKEREIYEILVEIAEDLYPIGMDAIKTKVIRTDYDINAMHSYNIEMLIEYMSENVPKEKENDFSDIVSLIGWTQVRVYNCENGTKLDGKQVEYWQRYIDSSNKLFEKYDKTQQDIIYANNPVQKYMDERAITLTGKDVQYDMANNLDEKFVIDGRAELNDYYNYCFDDIEKDYFCVEVTPTGGSYSDRWYLYFNRDSFKELFEKLKQGEHHIIATCIIPKNRYENGMDNMAFVKEVGY